MNKESHLVEYKRELPEGLERSVIAFLNSGTGGHIYIGIDNDGSVYGIKDADGLQRQIADRILNNIKPNAIGLFEIVVEENESKNVIHVIVSGGTEKPYYLKKFGMTPNGCFVRVGSTVHEMSEKMILESFASRAKLSLAKIPSPRQDLTFSQLKIYYEESKKALNSQFAKTLELLTPDGKYNYNAYLLADENGVSIKVARYRGKDKYDLIESEEFGYCSLIKAVKSVLTRLKVANITQTKITPMERIEKPLVDPVALREAVINAVVHNDYTREVPPLFEIFSDRMEITTYGGLVEGLSKADFFNCCSMPRNRELMRIFHDLDMVEQLGSGMRRILRAYDENSFSFTDHFMRTSFYFDAPQKQDDRINDKLGSRLGSKLGSELGSTRSELTYTRRRILELMEIDSRISIAQISEKLGFSTTAIEKNIDYLKVNGYLQRKGKTSAGYWEILK
ncbi:RNA-binding domain-containing protein [Hallerella succinigenes]|nr:RNA-binding domain-containing protein [Hallerella succinigenes]